MSRFAEMAFAIPAAAWSALDCLPLLGCRLESAQHTAAVAPCTVESFVPVQKRPARACCGHSPELVHGAICPSPWLATSSHCPSPTPGTRNTRGPYGGEKSPFTSHLTHLWRRRTAR